MSDRILFYFYRDSSFSLDNLKTFSLLFLVETCQTLLRRDLRSNLFAVFAGWSGKFGQALNIPSAYLDDKPGSELQLSVLQAMSALLCCGPCFNPSGLAEDGSLYPWLDLLLASKNEKVFLEKNYFHACNK